MLRVGDGNLADGRVGEIGEVILAVSRDVLHSTMRPTA